MLKSKLKDFQKINSNLKDNLTSNIKYQPLKKITNVDNTKIQEKIPKKKFTGIKAYEKNIKKRI